MTTRVKVKPHIAKFLFAIYGNPVVLPTGDEVYYDLLQLLGKEFNFTDKPIKENNLVEIKIQLPCRAIANIGHTLTEQQQHFLNQKLAKWFNKNCYVFINYLIKEHGMSARQAIITIQQRFDIDEEELSYDSFEKSYSRRKGEVKKIFNDFVGITQTNLKNNVRA
jgi:hypothetical protein